MTALAGAWPRVPAVAVAAILAVAWLALGPATPDLAAALYREELFSREGFAVYDSAWYGGHNMPGYSLVSPPLSALVGARVSGALAAVAAAALFERLATARWGTAARPAVGLYAIATVTSLLIGRVAYGLGVAVALGALLALQRGRPRLAAALGAACAVTSPVAGLFLVLVVVAVWLADRTRRDALAVGAATFAGVVVLAALFPEGGVQPCSIETLLAVLAASAFVAAVAGPHERVVRTAAGLYAAAGLLSFVVPTPMGGNVSRLGAEFAIPVVAGMLCANARGRRLTRGVLLVGAVGLAGWQWLAPVRETAKASVDDSASAAYYAPVIRALDERTDGPVRVEVPFTRLHYEAVHVAERFPLARGWQTQLDVKYNRIFQTRRLSAARYEDWLRRNAVSYVALPDAPPDPSGRAEGALIRTRPSYLEPVWRSAHWQLFRVRRPASLVDGPARLLALRSQSFVLEADRAASVLVRVRWTQYWAAPRRTCATRAGGGWTRVRVPAAGRYRFAASFSVARALRSGRACPRDPAAPVPAR